jgi:hypothetical protein
VPPPRKWILYLCLGEVEARKVCTDHVCRNFKCYTTYSFFLEPSTENYFAKFTSGALPVHASIIPLMKLVSYVAFLIFLCYRWKICATEGCNRSFSQWWQLLNMVSRRTQYIIDAYNAFYSSKIYMILFLKKQRITVNVKNLVKNFKTCVHCLVHVYR